MNQTIQERQLGYIEVLRKEVTAAKTIMGNKDMRDKVITELNFDKVYEYNYKSDLKEAIGGANTLKSENYDPNKVKIVVKQRLPPSPKKIESSLDNFSEMQRRAFSQVSSPNQSQSFAHMQLLSNSH